jgi:catechol 2,3-dioxygenase-like lactoylglutathione lyase family enzyme
MVGAWRVEPGRGASRSARGAFGDPRATWHVFRAGFASRPGLIEDPDDSGDPAPVHQSIAHIALVVRDYDEAIDFYVGTLGFHLVEDTYQPGQDKRWVVVSPPGSSGTSLLLARASTDEQSTFVGNQAGGRVFLFLQTDDFWRDYERMVSRGVRFVRPPGVQAYGTVAVFEDLYGNRWDLLQYAGSESPLSAGI